MRNYRCKTISIIILAVLVLMGCAQPEMEDYKELHNVESDVVAIIRLPNEGTQTRTIVPGKLVHAEHYTVVLTDTSDPENVYTFNNQHPEDGIIEIKGVKAGTYKVHVDGFNTRTGTPKVADVKILTGDSKENLTIYNSNKVGGVSVILDPIFGDGTTGNIQVTFNWSLVGTNTNALPTEDTGKGAIPPLQAAINDGMLKFQIYTGTIGQPYKPCGNPIVWDKSAEGADPEQITCLFEGIPTGEDITVKFSILNRNNEAVVENKLNLTALVYADQTSKWINSETGSEIYFISNDFNTWFSNISDLEIRYPQTEKDSSFIITWGDDKNNDGSSLFKTINLEIGKLNALPGDESIQKIAIDTASLQENSYTVTGLVPNQEYYIKSSTISQSGKPSNTYLWLNNDGTGFKTKVDIADITFNEPASLEMTTGETMQLTATITSAPEGLPVTFPHLTWSSSEEGMFSLADISEDTHTATLRADKPGITKIKVVNNDVDDPVTKETVNTVTVKFASPTDIYASFTTEDRSVNNGIQVLWTAVPHATSYEVFRSVDSGNFESYKTVTENSFIDTALTSGTSYSYQVVAKNTAIDAQYHFDASSARSTASEAVTVPAAQITVDTAEIKDMKVTIIDAEGQNNITTINGVPTISLKSKSDSTMTIAIPAPIEGIKTYSWYVNGFDHAPAVTGTWEEANRIVLSNKLDYLNKGDLLQELTLVVNDGNRNYSGLIHFIVITKPVTSVTFNRDMFRESLRYATNSEASDLEFTATTVPNNATLGTIKYQIAEGSSQDVISIEGSTGKVTVLKPGKVTIEAVSVENPAIRDTLELEFYTPTIASNEALVNIVNDEISKLLEAADKHLEGDWFWGSSKGVYTAANAEAHASGGEATTTENSYPGYIKFTDYPVDGGYVLNGTVHIETKAPGNYAWGNNNLNYLGKKGKNNTITVTLPNTQGTATIKYNQLLIGTLDASSKPNGGTYDVAYQQELMDMTGKTLLKNKTLAANSVNNPAVNITR